MLKDEFLSHLQQKAHRRVSPKSDDLIAQSATQIFIVAFGGDVRRTEGGYASNASACRVSNNPSTCLSPNGDTSPSDFLPRPQRTGTGRDSTRATTHTNGGSIISLQVRSSLGRGMIFFSRYPIFKKPSTILRVSGLNASNSSCVSRFSLFQFIRISSA